MTEPRDPSRGTDPQHTRPLPPVDGRAGERDPWARPLYGAPAGGEGPGGGHGSGSSAGPAPAGPAPAGARKRFTGGALVTGMVLAALVGAGTAAGTDALLDRGATGTAGGSAPASVIVNDQDEVNAVTAAAQKASPSTVTISVSAGNQAGSGSGVVVDDEGHILTNTHVVTLDGTAGDPSIEVRLDDGTVHPATVVGTDPLSDLAVLKVDAPGLVPAELGSIEDVNVGDTAIAIGAPLGLSGTVTDGIVSTLDRTIAVASSAAPDTPSEGDGGRTPGRDDFFFDLPEEGGGGGSSRGASESVYLNVIQTDAAINSGNSGGPLVDRDGRVIGINVAIASAGASGEAGNIGVGFAIPVDTARRVAEEIIADGSASHGYLGTTVSAAAAADGRSQAFSAGAQVQEVVDGSPADEAGLRAGDVITEFNGHRIEDATSLTAAVRELPAGGTGTAVYLRDGEQRTVEVTVADAAEQG
ncbi:S1C family serine protease [Kocuria flava]|uniref:S1C family serine protease n=1 Tax=Kocuria flava TaxID=446860 RepID=UPI002F92EDB3